MQRLEKKGVKNIVRPLLFLVLRCTGASKWPPAAHDREVFRMMATKLHETNDKLLDKLKFTGVGDQQRVMWEECGVYQFLPAGEAMKTHVKHIEGQEVAVPKDLELKIGNFWIVNPYDDEKATIKYGRRSIFIQEFFPEGFLAGVRSKEANERLHKAAASEAAKLDIQNDATAAVVAASTAPSASSDVTPAMVASPLPRPPPVESPMPKRVAAPRRN